MATITKLKSGTWRAQIRRKGVYVNETFLRRKDAEIWAIDTECRIDRGEENVGRKRKKIPKPSEKSFGCIEKIFVKSAKATADQRMRAYCSLRDV